MKLKEVLEKSTHFLKAKGFPSPRLDAEMLISSALNFSRIELYTKFDYPLNEEEVAKSRQYVVRRQKGEPVAYIVGQKEFYRYPFVVGPGVLVPRPETEHVVDAIKDHIQSIEDPNHIEILEIGVGSGCIGLTLLKEFPGAQLTGIEISNTALGYAQKNAERLRLGERVCWINQDADQVGLAKVFDVIISNPPYIYEKGGEFDPHVKSFEPSEALFAQEEGMQYIRSWSKRFVSLLKSQGLLAFEIGYDQGERAKSVFQQLGIFKEIKVIRDYSERDRVLLGIK